MVLCKPSRFMDAANMKYWQTQKRRPEPAPITPMAVSSTPRPPGLLAIAKRGKTSPAAVLAKVMHQYDVRHSRTLLLAMSEEIFADAWVASPLLLTLSRKDFFAPSSKVASVLSRDDRALEGRWSAALNEALDDRVDMATASPTSPK